MAILVPYDGSKPAQEAVEHAIERHPDRELVLLRVIEMSGGFTEALVDAVQEKLKEERGELADEVSEELQELLDTEGLEYRVETAVGDPAKEIVRFAEENDVEHIVVGNHGREGVSRVLLGSVAEEVVRRAPMPVTVVR